MFRLFIILILIWAVLRGFLLWLAWTGNPDPAARDRVLAYFTPEDIAKGEAYSRNGFWAKVTLGYWQIIFLLVGIFSGFFSGLYSKCDAFAGGRFWLSNFTFTIVFLLLYDLVNLPFTYYLGFICERQMGFTSMTSNQWFWRWIKGVSIGSIIQAIGFLLFLWIIRTFPRTWPVMVPAATTLYSVIVTLLFPILITPLFYEQKPLSDGPLKEKILDIAAKAGIPISGIYEIDESRYSKHTNAYFTGLGSHKRIVLYDTLVKSHTVDEAALIFAHEVGHWQHDHMAKGIALGFLGGLLGCLCLWLFFPVFQAEPVFKLQPLWSAANLPWFLVVTTVGSLFLSPIEAQISQYFERQADLASLNLTSLKKTFIDAEIRLARDNRSHLLPHPWRVFWLYSHPPVMERIAMAESWVPPSPPSSADQQKK